MRRVETKSVKVKLTRFDQASLRAAIKLNPNLYDRVGTSGLQRYHIRYERVVLLCEEFANEAYKMGLKDGKEGDS